LILPYFIFGNYAVALAVTIITGIIIIFAFNFYILVAWDLNFKKSFRRSNRGPAFTVDLEICKVPPVEKIFKACS